MKKYIASFFIYSMLCLWIYIFLIYGYDSVTNDFQMNSPYKENIYSEYIHELWTLVYYISVPYLIIYFIIFLFRKSYFLNMIYLFNSLFLLYFSINLAYDEYYHNYIFVSELNQFNHLREIYGESVNLFYMLPVFLAIIHNFISLYLFFKYRY